MVTMFRSSRSGMVPLARAHWYSPRSLRGRTSVAMPFTVTAASGWTYPRTQSNTSVPVTMPCGGPKRTRKNRSSTSRDGVVVGVGATVVDVIDVVDVERGSLIDDGATGSVVEASDASRVPESPLHAATATATNNTPTTKRRTMDLHPHLLTEQPPCTRRCAARRRPASTHMGA